MSTSSTSSKKPDKPDNVDVSDVPFKTLHFDQKANAERICKFCGASLRSRWPEAQFCSSLCWQKSLSSAQHDNFSKWLRNFEESLRQQRRDRAAAHRKIYLIRDRDGSYICDIVGTGLETVPLELRWTHERHLAKRFRGDELHSETATVSLMQRIIRGHSGAKQIRVR